MDVKLPNLGEGTESGIVIGLFVKEGDRIEKDQPLLELENEKAVASVPSTASGIVGKLHVKTGDKITVGQKLATITEGNGSGSSAPAAAPAAKEVKRAPAKQPESKQAEEVDEAEADEPTDEPTHTSNGEIAAAPSLRRMATTLGIDLGKVRGSERGGRIVVEDVRSYIQKLIRAGQSAKATPAATPASEKPAPEKVDFSKWGEISKKPMSTLRKVIARRMVENWNAIPHVTQFDDADLTTIIELRKKYLADYEKQGTRLTVTSFVLKAVVNTLKKHTVFNTSLDEAAEEIVFKEYFHIGMAVDTEAGLLVPVIRDVDKKTLVQLSKDLEELAKKAKDRKLTPDELKGGTFTISNQGGIGGAHFTPIVNKPEVAILGLGKGAFKAVVRNNAIESRLMMPIALSYDHRVVDGGSAARFTVDLLDALQNFKEEDVKIG